MGTDRSNAEKISKKTHNVNGMERIHIPIEKRNESYHVLVGSDLNSALCELLISSGLSRFAIITDSDVRKRYADDCAEVLHRQGCSVEVFDFPAGEAYKTQETKTKLDHALLEKGFGRDSMIVAIGGGVVGDIAGYVAATYMRGIPYIHVPTTLLAMVDSSIGGKVGINTPQGKNLVGAFWQPQGVVCDMAYLDTLPEQQLVNGFLEALKMFITSDPDMFAYVRDHKDAILSRDHDVLTKVITRAIQIKSEIVATDERESSERMIVNFGHTIGHAIERVSDYVVPHGFAIAQGMLVEMEIAVRQGILDESTRDIVAETLALFGVSVVDLKSYVPGELLEATKHDKKVRNGKPCYVLLKDIGEVDRTDGLVAHAVKDELVLDVLNTFCNQ